MTFPPHCVRPGCINENPILGTRWYQQIQPYQTKTFGWVTRWQCLVCRKTFSTQTFSIDYYAKKKLDLTYIYNQINAGAGLRNIGRDLGVKSDVIANRVRRLARNAVIAHLRILDHLPFEENLVLDGFESFCGSQYFPDNTTTVVGQTSQFVYACDYVTIRRKGRMTPEQKEHRKTLEKTYRAHPKNIENSFRTLLDLIQRWEPRSPENPLILITDEKKEYQRALWDHHSYDRELFSGYWRHHMVNSELPRTRFNPLFPVNYIDREIRKDMACHARQTLQWIRNVNNGMQRMFLYLYDHNVRKPFRIINGADPDIRHVTVAGLSKVLLDQLTDGFFTRRFFGSRAYRIETPFMRTLLMNWRTPMKRKPDWCPKYMPA